MISTHTGQSVPMKRLRENGAMFEHLGNGLYHVEFPARNGVGPIGGTWRIEPSDEQDEAVTRDTE